MELIVALQAWYLTRIDHLTDELQARHDDESGQGAVEYVGIVIVVVAIIAALSAFGPRIGRAIGNGLQNVVNDFTG